MSGMDCDSNVYVHVLDPVLGLDFSGDNVNDTYFCRALSSLLLGDIDAQISLGLWYLKLIRMHWKSILQNCGILAVLW